MPTERFSHTVDVPTAPDDVWVTLQQPETWRGIGPIDEVWDATHDERANLSGYRWSATAAGKRWEGTALRVATEPGRSLRLALESPEVTGALEVIVEPGNSSRLTVTLEASPRGTLATLFWGVVSDALRRGIVTQVEQFAERVVATSPGSDQLP